MSLTNITIDFVEAAETFISRSTKGTMCLVFKIDEGKASGETTTESAAIYTFKSAAEVDGTTESPVVLNALHKKMAKRCFTQGGRVNKLIVSVASDVQTAFENVIQDNKFSWVCMGTNTSADIQTFINSFISYNSCNTRKMKLMITSEWQSAFSITNDHIVAVAENGITFTEDGATVTVANLDFWQFLPRICGLACACPISEGLAYRAVPEATSINDEFVFGTNLVSVIWQDGAARLTHGVTCSGASLGIIEAKDIIQDDIHVAWVNNFCGKLRNTKQNEMSFCSAVLGYFKQLQDEGVINPDETPTCEIDVAAMRTAHATYYAQKSDDWVRNHPYGTEVRLIANIRLMDIMNNLTVKIYLGE